MTTSIEAFLAPNVTPIENAEVNFDRFKAPFIVKPLSQAEAETIRKANMKREKNKLGGTTAQLNQNGYVDGLILAAVVQPDLNNADLQKSYGTPGKPLDTLRAMLLAGEYAELGNQVQKVSGFDEEEDVDEVAEDVKK